MGISAFLLVFSAIITFISISESVCFCKWCIYVRGVCVCVLHPNSQCGSVLMYRWCLILSSYLFILIFRGRRDELFLLLLSPRHKNICCHMDEILFAKVAFVIFVFVLVVLLNCLLLWIHISRELHYV